MSNLNKSLERSVSTFIMVLMIISMPSFLYNILFYISFKIHDHLVHNYITDTRDAHNIMPHIIMKRLGLECTRYFKIILQIDSRPMKILIMSTPKFISSRLDKEHILFGQHLI